MRLNVKLKTAIVESRQKQRRIARLAGITETRMSQIVHEAHHAATPRERRKLARVLQRSEAELFETPVVEAVA